MNYRIAIPSYKRYDIIQEKSLKYLNECNIPNECIDIFVANEEEYELYKNNLPNDLYGNIILGVEGLFPQRNFITDYYPNNQPLICMDDDIEELKMLKKGKLVHIDDQLDDIINYGFYLMKKYDTTLCGIYAVDNAFFMSNTLSVGLYFCVGLFHWRFNDKDYNQKLTITNKDDYERCIKTYLKKGKVIRFDNITATTNYYSEKGGLQSSDERTAERIEKAGKYLINKYPNLCVENKGRKNQYFEIKFKRQNANKKLKL